MFAGFPIALMSFIEMISAQGMSRMIDITTVAGIREGPILFCVITNPISTARGLDKVRRFSAQTASGFFRSGRSR
jgi:hypothetical protein